jgi:hypothetical protein
MIAGSVPSEGRIKIRYGRSRTRGARFRRYRAREDRARNGPRQRKVAPLRFTRVPPTRFARGSPPPSDLRRGLALVSRRRGRKAYRWPMHSIVAMSAWRVTYLPDSTTETLRPVSVTIEDPGSPSLEAFVSRLTGGAFGVEWTQGRIIRSVEAFERYENQHRRRFVTALLVALVAGIVVTGVALLGFAPTSPLYQHSWSATTYTGAVCAEGCFGQPIAESFPNGSQVSGSWTAPQPAVIFIHTSNGTICPGGTPSSYGPEGSCSEPGVTSGTFSFASTGGTVDFTAGSQNPENVSVSGYWSA